MNKKVLSIVMSVCIVTTAPVSVYADTVANQPSSQSITSTDKIIVAPINNWQHHYSYNSALELKLAGVWDDVMDQSKPDDPIARGTFLELLKKVTGSTDNLAHTLPSGVKQSITRSEAAAWINTFTSFNTGISNQHAPFKDVPANNQYRIAIDYVYHTGIMFGDGSHYMPSQVLTKGQAAIVLVRILHRMTEMTTALSYTDVTANPPESAYTMAEENKTEPGIYSVVDGNARYVMVAAGTKPTTGYAIKIGSVRESAGAIYVNTHTTSPAPGEIEAMHITYPYAIIKLADTKKPVFWVNIEMKFSNSKL